MKKTPIIDPRIKELLGFDKNDSDAKVIKEWKKASSRVCKPCWELKYCPYGPIVETFPLLPSIRVDAIKHNEYLKECLQTEILGNGQKLDEKDENILNKKLMNLMLLIIQSKYHKKYLR